MKPSRRRLQPSEFDDMALGYEAATPHLTLTSTSGPTRHAGGVGRVLGGARAGAARRPGTARSILGAFAAAVVMLALPS